MACPKCGNEMAGNFCSQCGWKLKANTPSFNPQVNNPAQRRNLHPVYSQSPHQNLPPQPNLFSTKSIVALILLILSPIIWWSGMISTYLVLFIGFIFGGIGIILAISSKNPNRTMPKILTAFGIIILTTEFVLWGVLELIAMVLGV